MPIIDCRVRSYYRQPVYFQLVNYHSKPYIQSKIILAGVQSSTLTIVGIIPRPSDWREEGGGEKAWYPLHVHALHFPYNLLYTNPYHVLTNEMVNMSKEYRMTS